MSKKRFFNFFFGFVIFIFLVNIASIKITRAAVCHQPQPCDETSDTNAIFEFNGTKYLFDSTPKLISISDKNSNTITLTYDDTNQNLVSVSDGTGREIT